MPSLNPKWMSVLIAAGGLLPASLGLAQPQPTPALTPAQLQHISRSLTRFQSHDFFEQGRQRAEREARRLIARQNQLEQGILKISPDLKLPNDFGPMHPSQSLAPVWLTPPQ